MADTQLGVCDVHGHYLPPAAMDLMTTGSIVVGGGRNDESINVNGMLVGATIRQLSVN